MNQLQLHQLLPDPLKDSVLGGELWRQDFVFHKGTYYLVQADSGKGKSTLLNVIYGTRTDYSGSVHFDAINIRSMNSNAYCELRSKKIAYLFQDLRLFGALTARENITLKPGNSITSAEIEWFAEKLGVLDHMDRPCAKLSLGQQQRIAIIRAIAQPFDWLLLDEPFSHLDRNNAEIAMKIMLDRCQLFGAGIIATSLGDKTGFQHFQLVQL